MDVAPPTPRPWYLGRMLRVLVAESTSSVAIAHRHVTYAFPAKPGIRDPRWGPMRDDARGGGLAKRDASSRGPNRKERDAGRTSPDSPLRRPVRPVGSSTAASDSPLPIVLALIAFYPPAYRAGGPPRAVPRIVDELSDEFRFLVITRDRDLGASTRLAGVVPDRWVNYGSGRCLYLSTRRRLMGGLIASVRRSQHDALYLNSLFSIEFSLIPLLLRLTRFVPRRGLVIAPRGEMDESALAIKRRRKQLYLWCVRKLRVLDDAIWHAASEDEAQSIRQRFGTQIRVAIASDIPMRPGMAASETPKQAGTLEVIFLSRIARMKNLDFAISALATVRGNVNFNVFGPIEDRPYWADCQRLAKRLPGNVRLRYRGLVKPDEVTQVIERHHLFFLPTQGESFGHAIVESLMAGCPVLISDQTPWRNLEARRAGWELPLSRPDLFCEAIERCVGMTQAELATWSAGARRLGHEIADNPALDAAYRLIFRAALNPGEDASLLPQG